MSWTNLTEEIASEMGALSVPAVFDGLSIRRVKNPARPCATCGSMLFHSPTARFCPPCRRQRDLEGSRTRARSSYARRSEKVKAERSRIWRLEHPLPACADCGICLEHRNAKRCKVCRPKHRKAQQAVYMLKWRKRRQRAQSRSSNVPGRGRRARKRTMHSSAR